VLASIEATRLSHWQANAATTESCWGMQVNHGVI